MSEPGAAKTAPSDESIDIDESATPDTEAPRAKTADAEPHAAEPPQPREPQQAGRQWWVRHYTFTGTTVGLIFVWFSMTPSLLPRGALFQGLVSGCSGAIGYGLGVFAVWLVRYMRAKDSSPPAPRWAWMVLVPIGAVGMVVMAIGFHVWQDDVRDLMGVATPASGTTTRWPRSCRWWCCSRWSKSASSSAGWSAFWSDRSTGSHRFASRRPSWWSCSWC